MKSFDTGMITEFFTNSPQNAELIVKHITEILIELGMRLNPQKTIASSNVVEDSIKPDKLFWILNKRGNKNLQEHLFLIHSLSKKHPNSGSLVKALSKFISRIAAIDKTKQNINVFISIIVDIAYRNPRVYPISTAILSKLFSFLGESEVKESISLIVSKFEKLPNTGHLQVWLQRAILKHERNRHFEEKLCQKLNDPSIFIWNSEWLSDEIKNLINGYSFVDEEILDSMDEVLSQEEVQLFGAKTNYYN